MPNVSVHICSSDVSWLVLPVSPTLSFLFSSCWFAFPWSVSLTFLHLLLLCWLFFCDLLAIFLSWWCTCAWECTYLFIHIDIIHIYIYNYMPLSMFPAFIFLLLSVLGCESSKWRSASSRSIFLLWLELLRITQFLFESFKDVPLVTNYVDRHLAPNTGWNMSNCDVEVCFVSESLGIRWKCWSVWG